MESTWLTPSLSLFGRIGSLITGALFPHSLMSFSFMRGVHLAGWRDRFVSVFFTGGGGGGRIVGLLEEAFDRTDFLLPELYPAYGGAGQRDESGGFCQLCFMTWRCFVEEGWNSLLCLRSHQKVVQIPMCNSSLQFLWNWPIRKMARRHPPLPETKNDFFFPFRLHRA